MKRKLAVLPALLMIFTMLAGAVGVPPAPTSGFIVDNAEVLDRSTITSLNERGSETDYATGTAVVVVTTDYTGTYAIDEYCDAVFDEWQIEDGIVLTLAIGDENYYAMPSAGLGRYLTTSRVQELLDTSLEPDFAKGDYDAGVRKIYSALCDEVETLYQQYGQAPAETESAQNGITAAPQQAFPQPVPQEESGISLGDAVVILVLIMIVVLLAAGLMLRPRRRRQGFFGGGGYVPPPPPPRRSFWGGFFRPRRYHRAPPPPPPPHHPPHGPGGPGAPGSGPRPGGGFGGSGPRPSGGFGGSGPKPGGGFGGGGGRGGGAGRNTGGAPRRGSANRSGSSRSGGFGGGSRGGGFGGSSRGGGFGGGGGRGGGAGRGGGRH